MRWWRLLVTGVIVVSIAGILSGCQIKQEEGSISGKEYEVQVLEHKLVNYPYPPGYYARPGVLVKVRNDRNFALYDIRAQVRWYADDGTFLGSSTGSFSSFLSLHLSEHLEPGEIAKFKVEPSFGVNAEGVSSYKLVEVVGRKYDEKERYELEILEQKLGQSMQLGMYVVPTVLGKAKNDRNFALRDIQAQVRWYANDESFLGSSYDDLGWEHLEPGEVWEFKAAVDPLKYRASPEKIDHYKLKVTGTRYRT